MRFLYTIAAIIPFTGSVITGNAASTSEMSHADPRLRFGVEFNFDTLKNIMDNLFPCPLGFIFSDGSVIPTIYDNERADRDVVTDILKALIRIFGERILEFLGIDTNPTKIDPNLLKALLGGNRVHAPELAEAVDEMVARMQASRITAASRMAPPSASPYTYEERDTYASFNPSMVKGYVAEKDAVKGIYTIAVQVAPGVEQEVVLSELEFQQLTKRDMTPLRATPNSLQTLFGEFGLNFSGFFTLFDNPQSAASAGIGPLANMHPNPANRELGESKYGYSAKYSKTYPVRYTKYKKPISLKGKGYGKGGYKAVPAVPMQKYVTYGKFGKKYVTTAPPHES